MSTVIEIKNVSKQYRLGQVGTGTIRNDLNRWWAGLRGKEDPFLKIGSENRLDITDGEYIWALKDINLEVEQGEVLGIIGKNGAGKSTLLKILSRVTSPTTGEINIKGRIASLLEVGTGFNPDLTGRENIFLNGAILGMTKYEINTKFDEIVDFSGVEKYIDTPVKRYSSGMHVRLAFAVAAYLEPEILVVDEVLAVGDFEFQKKAIGKMQDVSRNEGRTVLFVSHNMTAIENLCNKLCILKNGEFDFQGNINEGISLYLKDNQGKQINSNNNSLNDEVLILNKFEIRQDFLFDNFITNQTITVTISYEIKKETIGLRVGFELIDDSTGIIIFRTFHDENKDTIVSIKPGKYSSIAQIPPSILKEGSYSVSLLIGIHNVRWIAKDTIRKQISINNIGGVNKIYADKRPGIIMPYIEWETY